MKCKHAIIGAGISGLSVAANLAKLIGNGEGICVFEKNYIGSGCSTRNAGRYRVHFGAEENLKFAIESAKYLQKLKDENKFNTLLAKTGYLWLIFGEEDYKLMKKHNEIFKKYGVPLIEISPEDTYKKYPFLKERRELIASFLGPQNGSFHHDAVVYGFWKAGMKLGVKYFEYAEVTKIMVDNFEVKAIEVNHSTTVDAENVILSAGVHIKTFSDMLGLNIPIEPVRKEIMVTEPYAFAIEPFIIDTISHTYFSQTLKGEIIGSTSTGKEKRGIVELQNTIYWLVEFSKRMRAALKGSENVRIMRVWSGFYEMTPDRSHIVGKSEDWPYGIYVIGGFSGHGFMLGPFAGKLLASYIHTGKIDELIAPYSPDRFKTNKLINETFIIG